MEKGKEKPFKPWRRKTIHLIDETNDVKFRGIFSYRHARILGWLFMAVAQIGMVLSLSDSLKGIEGQNLAAEILSFFGSLTAPLFLIAAFSQILVAKDGYRRLLILYGGGALMIFLAFLIVYYHHIVGFINVLSPGPGEARETASALMALASQNGFFCFNIFIDLVLCSLLTFFINYRPKVFFPGKWIYAFRCLAILPIAYEITSIVLKICVSCGAFILPPVIFPLLTTKPPLAFIVFIAAAFFVKNRERFFIKKGKTLEQFARFQDTNVNRGHFNAFIILAIFVAALIDLILLIVLSVFYIRDLPPDIKNDSTVVELAVTTVMEWGFGKTLPMLLITPLLIFYDYRKTYDNRLVDILIPAAGAILVVLTMFEGTYLAVRDAVAHAMKEPPAETSSLPETSQAIRTGLISLVGNIRI